jgi:uncharacterized protein YodC (DUF2158 family)
MNDMEYRFRIGAIVKLKDGKNKMKITGYFMETPTPNKVTLERVFKGKCKCQWIVNGINKFGVYHQDDLVLATTLNT